MYARVYGSFAEMLSNGGYNRLPDEEYLRQAVMFYGYPISEASFGEPPPSGKNDPINPSAYTTQYFERAVVHVGSKAQLIYAALGTELSPCRGS